MLIDDKEKAVTTCRPTPLPIQDKSTDLGAHVKANEF